MDDLKDSLGFRYLQETKFDEQTLWRKPRLVIAPAHPYKQYAEAEKFKLPTDWQMDKSLHESLQYRRSCRRYADTPLSMENLAMLLWGQPGDQRQGRQLFFQDSTVGWSTLPGGDLSFYTSCRIIIPGALSFSTG